jgi:uncharacterized membrane protein
MYWSLLGVLIVVIGFILKFDPLAIVVVAGIVTGLIGDLGFVEILETLGNAFVSQRVITIFVITLPAVGLMERYGLRERASWVIGQIKGAKASGVLSIYVIVRILVGAFGLRLGGHPQFIRPLIMPMAEGATEANYDHVPEEEKERIKWLSAAAENYGNFFGQNIFVGAGGVLLIIGTLAEHGLIPEGYGAPRVAMFSIPIGIVAAFVGVGQFIFNEKRLEKTATPKTENEKKGDNES